MNNNLKKLIIAAFFLLTSLSIGISVFNFWQIKDLKESNGERLEKLEYFYVDLPDLFKKELNKNIPDEIQPETLEKAQEIHKENNEDLKERSLKASPDGKKKAYFENKLVLDIRDIGNSDYASLIVEKENGEKEAVFQDNFHVGWFEWLNNIEIKAYKGCGSGCLLSYVINVNTKDVKEYLENAVK
ncbi:MAG: hypothetical protein A2288_01095 [Candidatus Moranbacteria bacterium RIFOXYA12_FULL_44_15]|nr:MAG: hypothetical protein A2288_01095 [Candidatus Moranbacteria bacterium RIFOXYA12_FULL_44_15]